MSNGEPPAVLAFNDPWHDSSFCIYDANGVTHVEMERFTRRKFETENPIVGFCEQYPGRVQEFQFIAVEEGDFLAPLIRRIVRVASVGEVDLPALAELVPSSSAPALRAAVFERRQSAPPPMHSIQAFLRHLIENKPQVCFYGHHHAHAANAFFSSGFRSALTITLDGGGTDYVLDDAGNQQPCELYGGVYRCEDTSIVRISHLIEPALGLAWTRVTEMLGLPWGDQGTVMAMAALGESSRFMKLFDEPFFWMRNFGRLDDSTQESVHRFLGGARDCLRAEQDRYDMAAALQAATEYRVKNYMQQYLTNDISHLCIAGGVALNCQLTGKIQRWFPNLRALFVPPAPYDGGVSMGGAQIVRHEKLGVPHAVGPKEMAPFGLGKTYSQADIVAACALHGLTARATDDHEIVGLLDSGRIVGLFGGPAESGRRALGHRSIIADPRDGRMKDKINAIKHRQWFRPLAPMVLAECVGQWFDCPDDFRSPYMSFAIQMRPGLQERVPAIVHLDGSARIQTVHRELSPLIHQFLSRWHQRTGVPMLVNTSFNDREPIVETPGDALETYRRIGMDAVYFIDHHMVVSKAG